MNVSRNMKHKEIKVYSTPACPWCEKVKEFLTANKIEFQDLNVADDRKARWLMIRRSRQVGVPVVDIDGEIIIGFDLPGLKSKLGV